jgi:hypothetical protein
MHYRLRPDLRSAMRQRYRYAMVGALLRRRYRALITEPASPPLWRLVPWLLARGVRYPWLTEADRDDLLLTGAKAAGRMVGGMRVLVGAAGSSSEAADYGQGSR